MKKFFCPVCLKPKPLQWCQQHGEFYTTLPRKQHKGIAHKREDMARMLSASRKAKGPRHRKVRPS